MNNIKHICLASLLMLLLTGCGGSSSDKGLSFGSPSVTVAGLEAGQTVTLTLRQGGTDLEDLAVVANGTSTFTSRISNGSSHIVLIDATTGGAVCRFGSGSTSSSSNPRFTHNLGCGAVVPPDDDDDGVDDGQFSLSSVLVDTGGTAVGAVERPIREDRAGVFRVTVTEDGAPVVGRVVNFSTTLGVLNPSSGTALTDSSGVAEIVLESGTVSGGGVITASFEGEIEEQSFQITVDGSGVGGEDPVLETLAFGNGTGGAFVEGELALSSLLTSVGSSVSVQGSIVVEPANTPWSGLAEVAFSSNCVDRGLATIDTPVISVGGSVATSYEPGTNCTSDIIRSTVTIGGEEFLAVSDQITISQSPTSSISFVGAEPPVIGIRGAAQAGVPEASVLTFLVRNELGQPVGSGVAVDFEVTAGTGGFRISSDVVGATNSSGEVRVTVNSGSVPTVGAVKATVQGTDISGVGQVSVQVGVPSQARFSIATTQVNPPVGSHLGRTVQVTARLADRMGNHVADGTLINFTTELGSIEPSCTTTAGGCSVLWTSSAAETEHFDDLRAGRACGAPEFFSGGDRTRLRSGLTMGISCGEHDRYGRTTITAWTTGEESFDDANGDNLFDASESWIALPEAFRDDNETGVRTQTGGHFDEFMDFDESFSYTPEGAFFRGVGCSDAAVAAGHCQSLANVRTSTVMTLSTDNIVAYVFAGPTDLTGLFWEDVGGGSPLNWGRTELRGEDVSAVNPADYILDGTTNQIADVLVRNGDFRIVLADINGNAPPVGTVVTVLTDNPALVVNGPAECTIGNRTEYDICEFSVTNADVIPGTRIPLFFQITTEGGDFFRRVVMVSP